MSETHISDMKKDISHLEDIRLLVNEFYRKVQMNPLIGPIFIGVIQDRWPEHLEKMYRFWQTVLLDENTYNGRPFPPHAQMPLDQKHFDVWLGLFLQTVDENFDGTVADDAKMRAQNMASMFLNKIEHIRQYPNQKTL